MQNEASKYELVKLLENISQIGMLELMSLEMSQKPANNECLRDKTSVYEGYT